MASRVGGDLSKIQTGPCRLDLDDESVGHTMEGIKLNVQPDIRVRNVDEFGVSKVDMIYQGEAIQISTTLAEKTISTLRLVFAWGYETSTTRHSFGRLPGLRGSDIAKELRIHPLEFDDDDESEDAVFYKVCVSNSAEVNIGSVSADRTFGVTFDALVDESKTEAQGLLGYIGAAA